MNKKIRKEFDEIENEWMCLIERHCPMDSTLEGTEVVRGKRYGDSR